MLLIFGKVGSCVDFSVGNWCIGATILCALLFYVFIFPRQSILASEFPSLTQNSLQ